LLEKISPLEIDYVIVGSDNNDIFSTLTGHYEKSFFSFEPHSLDEFYYEVVFYPQPSSHRSSSIASQNDEYNPHGQKQFDRGFGSNESYNEERTFPPQRGFSTDLGESASIGGGQLFEEKAVILASQDDYLSNSKAALLEVDNEDDGFRHNMNGNKSNTSEERYLDEQYEDWSDEQSKNNRMMISQPDGNEGTKSQQQQQQEANDNKSEYDLDSFIVEDNDEEGMDSLTASPYMLDHHHVIHAKELERQQLQHSHDENHPSPHGRSGGGEGGGRFPSSSSQSGQRQLHDQPHLVLPSSAEQPIYRKEIIARKPLMSRKHLKYYKQYSETPITFIDMLLYQAMTIDQWSSSSTVVVPVSEFVLSPKLQSPEEARNKEQTPKAFFSFVLANNPSHNH
jgi:hypothetical protein